ncbi:MAG: DUF938 domain-containing protein [Woeseia sp.]
MSNPPCSEAAERNKDAILEVLRTEFRDARQVLEIGSGTGQHAVHFGANLPQLTWQTSDLEENHSAILERLAAEGPPNVQPPLRLDVEDADAPPLAADAVFSANTAHIMSLRGVQCMLRLVGRALPCGGRFCLYGPFRFEGRASSDSNARFNAALRQQDAAMGVRDLADLDRLAAVAGLQRVRLYAMPANNHIAVWEKTSATKKTE